MGELVEADYHWISFILFYPLLVSFSVLAPNPPDFLQKNSRRHFPRASRSIFTFWSAEVSEYILSPVRLQSNPFFFLRHSQVKYVLQREKKKKRESPLFKPTSLLRKALESLFFLFFLISFCFLQEQASLHLYNHLPITNRPPVQAMHRTYSMRQSRVPTASQIESPPPPLSTTKTGRWLGKGGIGECDWDISYFCDQLRQLEISRCSSRWRLPNWAAIDSSPPFAPPRETTAKLETTSRRSDRSWRKWKNWTH